MTKTKKKGKTFSRLQIYVFLSLYCHNILQYKAFVNRYINMWCAPFKDPD